MTGYPTFLKLVEDRFTCPLCHGGVRCARLCRNCHQLFCSSCVTNWLLQQCITEQSCPACGHTSGSDVFQDVDWAEKVAQIIVDRGQAEKENGICDAKPLANGSDMLNSRQLLNVLVDRIGTLECLLDRLHSPISLEIFGQNLTQLQDQFLSTREHQDQSIVAMFTLEATLKRKLELLESLSETTAAQVEGIQRDVAAASADVRLLRRKMSGEPPLCGVSAADVRDIVDVVKLQTRQLSAFLQRRPRPSQQFLSLFAVAVAVAAAVALFAFLYLRLFAAC